MRDVERINDACRAINGSNASYLCEFSNVGSVRPYVQNRHIFDAVKEEIWTSPYTVGHPSIIVDFSLYC